MPKRIQRKRTKGWKMPPNTVYVGRPGKWGNPFVVGAIITTPQMAVDSYRKLVAGNVWSMPNPTEIKKQLRDKDLACWCALDQPCHADVLLEIAND